MSHTLTNHTHIIHHTYIHKHFYAHPHRRVRIPLNEIAEAAENGLSKQFTLFDEVLKYKDNGSYGSIQLKLRWVFDEALRRKRRRRPIDLNG